MSGRTACAPVLATHRRLTALLGHEQPRWRWPSVAVRWRCRRRCSARCSTIATAAAKEIAEVSELAPGVQVLGARERTNYPLTISVDDLGEDLRITALADAALGAERIAAYLHTALHSLLQACNRPRMRRCNA
jgi:arthrofactin-type cyclic lipopeptide synthetase B